MSSNTQQEAQQKDTMPHTKKFIWRIVISFFNTTWGSCWMPLPISSIDTWNSSTLHDKQMHVSLPHPTTLFYVLFSFLLVLFKLKSTIYLKSYIYGHTHNYITCQQYNNIVVFLFTFVANALGHCKTHMMCLGSCSITNHLW